MLSNLIVFNVINLVVDESWDVNTPTSPSVGSKDENDNERLGDREQVTSQQQNTDEQEQVNDVHDFFDS